MSLQRQPAADQDSARRESAKTLVSGLFGEWYGPLVRYAYRSTGSLETAEDVVQASFTELYRALLGGAAIENPKGWTLCVVRREIVDRLRERKRHGGAFLALSEAENLASRRAEPEPGGWEEQSLTRLLSGLSAREEEVLLLRAQALKYRQIAAELNIGINSVKTLLSRAIRKMQHAAAAARGGTGSKGHGDTIPASLQ
jgi:RNA polymerase sigma-70 factor (ECF subfamily)